MDFWMVAGIVGLALTLLASRGWYLDVELDLRLDEVGRLDVLCVCVWWLWFIAAVINFFGWLASTISGSTPLLLWALVLAVISMSYAFFWLMGNFVWRGGRYLSS